jgi:hypothetical protein
MYNNLKTQAPKDYVMLASGNRGDLLASDFDHGRHADGQDQAPLADLVLGRLPHEQAFDAQRRVCLAIGDLGLVDLDHRRDGASQQIHSRTAEIFSQFCSPLAEWMAISHRFT